jgi:hypothetical protein
MVPLVLYFATIPQLRRKGKTNLSHDGLNPAHVPSSRVNNPILGAFCDTILGRADIEESKSGVDKNSEPPQASYPCGNFSDTSSGMWKTRHLPNSKGSLGLAFAIRRCTEPPYKVDFSP